MRKSVLVGVLALVACGAQDVYAQACWGVPAGDGQGAVGTSIGLAEDVTSYGVSASANLRGPVLVGAGFSIHDIEDLDDNATSFGGQLGAELPTTSLSVCPTVGVSRTTFSTDVFGVDVDASGLQVPVTLAVGRRFDTADGLALVPSAEAGLIHIRSEVEAAGFEESESANEFLGRVGLTLGWQQIFMSGGISFTTEEDSDPSFGLGLGFVF
jgi:hypothetical protein